MNINISTTQWGDTEKSVAHYDAKSPTTISRYLIMALMTLTIAGLMVLQAL
jgi:hypothetical protein